MIIPFFIVGSFWFWVLLAICFFGILIAVEIWESYGTSVFLLVTTVLLLDLFGDSNILSWIRNNPLMFSVGVVGYFFAGTLWSIGKWFLFLRNKKFEIQKTLDDYTQRNPGVITPEMYRNWAASYAIKIPSLSNEKDRIIRWMCYWPWSLTYAVFADLTKEIFTTCFNLVRKVYVKIENSVLGDLKEVHETMSSDYTGPVSKIDEEKREQYELKLQMQRNMIRKALGKS